MLEKQSLGPEPVLIYAAKFTNLHQEHKNHNSILN